MSPPMFFNPYIYGGAVGGWKELGRTTLGSGNSNIDVTSIANKRYYMVLTSRVGASASINDSFQVGNTTFDTGTNYARRTSSNGAADGTGTSQDHLILTLGSPLALPTFGVYYFTNLAAKEKLLLGHSVNQITAGASNVPERTEVTGKWAQTSSVMDRIGMRTLTGTTFDTGSEVVVLGWDPADTHTTNFWEELASVSGGGTAAFNSGVFTSKKYLWVQMYIDRSADATNGEITVGNTTLDTGSNYSRRRSADGGADDTLTSQSAITLRTAGLKEFYNMFIINNSANEKLIILHQNAGGSAGAGTAPFRGEFVAKWANTSSQINIIGFGSGGANTLSSTSIMKVWGSN